MHAAVLLMHAAGLAAGQGPAQPPWRSPALRWSPSGHQLGRPVPQGGDGAVVRPLRGPHGAGRGVGGSSHPQTTRHQFHQVRTTSVAYFSARG